MKKIIQFFKEYAWALLQVLCVAICILLVCCWPNDGIGYYIAYVFAGSAALFFGCIWGRLRVVIPTAILSFVVVLLVFICKEILWIPAGTEPNWGNFLDLSVRGSLSLLLTLACGNLVRASIELIGVSTEILSENKKETGRS